VPRKVVDLELSEGIRAIWACERYDWIHVLVRYHGHPIGWVLINNGNLASVFSSEQVRYNIADQLGWELIWHVLGKKSNEQLHGSVSLKPISVIVCTRDRARQLEKCLKRLLAIDYPEYEIIVVDNASSNDETYRLVGNLPVHYVFEEKPGLNWARNRGISEARYGIIAFTDDDARPDTYWLRSMNAAFVDQEVMAVTGLVAPKELETSAQIYFELGYGGLINELKHKVIQRDLLSMRELLWASGFGVGANMAFRREVLELIGVFDVALDVGTPSASGGDMEMLHRLVAAGYTLVYDPGVLVWHLHRRDITSLPRQFRDYATGFGCYLITSARNHTVGFSAILLFALRDWLGWWILRRFVRPGWFPRRLILSELLGALRSPLAYRAAKTHAKQIARMSQVQ
jgi:glycosyltransferase involved in cell wall biosynthesis